MQKKIGHDITRPTLGLSKLLRRNRNGVSEPSLSKVVGYIGLAFIYYKHFLDYKAKS